MADPHPSIAIITALPRELVSMTIGWKRLELSLQGRRVQISQSPDCRAIVVTAGMGVASARVAAEAAWQHSRGHLRLFISAGYAGALDSHLAPGDIIRPADVIDDSDGLSIATVSGSGKLVTAGVVASRSLKRLFAEKHQAQAVDMEAYAVGDVARIYGVPFLAVKAITDDLEFPMPPLGKFISADGRLQQAAFTVYSAFRPWTWPTLFRLGRNSRRASAALARALQKTMETAAADYNGKKDQNQVIP